MTCNNSNFAGDANIWFGPLCVAAGKNRAQNESSYLHRCSVVIILMSGVGNGANVAAAVRGTVDDVRSTR